MNHHGGGGTTEGEDSGSDGDPRDNGGPRVPAEVLPASVPVVPAGDLRAAAEGGHGRCDEAVEAHAVAEHSPQGVYFDTGISASFMGGQYIGQSCFASVLCQFLWPASLHAIMAAAEGGGMDRVMNLWKHMQWQNSPRSVHFTLEYLPVFLVF